MKWNHKIDFLNELRRSTIFNAVTQGLYGTKPDWQQTCIKYVAEISPKVQIPKNLQVSFLSMASIKKGYYIDNQTISSDEVDSYTAFADGDLLMAKVSPCFENGSIAIVSDLQNGYGLGSSELYVLRASDKINAKFLMFFLMNASFVQESAANMTDEEGLKQVPEDFIANYKIPVPPLFEQAEIADYLDRKCAEIDLMIEAFI